ncbi:hypothetical protein HAX54_001162, partial [Datura stramonium]|nr:hypothetical protein [Datura stramonium]
LDVTFQELFKNRMQNLRMQGLLLVGIQQASCSAGKYDGVLPSSLTLLEAFHL